MTITTLSISIALVTTFFGFVNTAFYHPLPYPDARRTISLSHWGNVKIEVTELARVTHALQSIATFNEERAILGFGGSSFEIDATKIDTAFFRILKVGPILGSLPTPQEIRSNAQIVVIGERLWGSRFGGRSDIIGLTVALNGEQRRVIGVMPAWFTFPGSDEAWYPFRINEVAPTDEVNAIGRLADGATLADAEREANLIRARIRAADSYGAIRWGGLFLSPNMVERVARYDAAPVVWLLVGGAVCVLLVACTNVAALMLAREARRRSEMMIRASLGASGWQLVRQQLIESIVLAAISGIIAIVLSVWCTQMVLRLLPPAFVASLPGWVHFGLDMRVLGLALRRVHAYRGSLRGLARPGGDPPRSRLGPPFRRRPRCFQWGSHTPPSFTGHIANQSFGDSAGRGGHHSAIGPRVRRTPRLFD